MPGNLGILLGLWDKYFLTLLHDYGLDTHARTNTLSLRNHLTERFTNTCLLVDRLTTRWSRRETHWMTRILGVKLISKLRLCTSCPDYALCDMDIRYPLGTVLAIWVLVARPVTRR